MGKRKIGEIYNKPIIEGDINLKTPNEIHKSELSGELGGGGASGEVKVWYYKDVSDNKEMTLFLVSLGVKTILCKYRDYNGVGEGSIDYIKDEYAYGFYKNYFKLSTLDTCNSVNVGFGDDGIDHCYFNPSNDLYGRIDDIAKLMPEAEELKNLFIEVSKEEYESQITYKNPYL